jgi:hypothetical protein
MPACTALTVEAWLYTVASFNPTTNYWHLACVPLLLLFLATDLTVGVGVGVGVGAGVGAGVGVGAGEEGRSGGGAHVPETAAQHDTKWDTVDQIQYIRSKSTAKCSLVQPTPA